MKITKEVKAKIFSLYYGQSVLRWHQWIDSTPNSFVDMRTPMRLELSVGNGWYILLKPLSEISDEDLNMISEILGVIYPENFVNSIVENSNYAVNSTKCINSIQYLQSKGYALPYLDYSVDDLVELGVYKLT